MRAGTSTVHRQQKQNRINSGENSPEAASRKRQYNATCALYGYQKSKEDKHKLVIEPEEAAVVREIFNMKIAGTGTTLIAKTLNDRGIPCPTELYRLRGDTRLWKNKGSKCYWTACKVESIIRDEKYTVNYSQVSRHKKV